MFTLLKKLPCPLTKNFTVELTTKSKCNILRFLTLLSSLCSMVPKCHCFSQLPPALSSLTSCARDLLLLFKLNFQLLLMIDLQNFAFLFFKLLAMCLLSMDSGHTSIYRFSKKELII
jgi:hypothetical protein